jgi:hypothetical protein
MIRSKSTPGCLALAMASSLAVSAPMAAVRDVVINEVSWMGTTTSASDEWIELKNTTASSISLSGWTLNATDGTPAITLSGSIGPNGYFLLERTDDNTVTGIAADQIYTGALGNTGEHLKLKNGSGTVIDEVDAWYAGDNATKAAMERKDAALAGTASAAWATALTSYGGGKGTPRAVNSTVDDGTGGDPGCAYPDSLEILSINIGQGDATLIATPSRLLLADAGESYWNSHKDADKIAADIQARYGAGCNTLDYVVVSHIHLDHIGYIAADEDGSGNLLDENGGSYQEGENLRNPQFLAGLAYLVKNNGFVVGKTIVRDYKAHNPNKPPSEGGSKTYRNWRAYLESPDGIADFNPETAVLGDGQINLGTVAGNPVKVDIVLVDGLTPNNPASAGGCSPATYFGGSQYLLRGQTWDDSNPPSENDLSIGFVLSLGEFNMWIGGDASGENYDSPWGYRYRDVETCLAKDPLFMAAYGRKIDVLRANHHGSSHSTNQAFVDSLNAKVTIFSAGDNNTFGHVDAAVRDRTLAKSHNQNGGRVFQTESGADVSQASDACHSTQGSWCAEVADQEYPSTTESDEAGDDGVRIMVKKDGGGYRVQGFAGYSAVYYQSH